MQSYPDVLDMIGETPMLELHRFDTGPCRLFAKLEYMNPGGSIKDRIARSMIEAAQANGDLKPGGTIVEATAGNTGLGLALVALQKGYRLVLVLPDKMSLEKINTVRCMGAEVIITRSDVAKGHPEYYQDVAKRIALERGAFFINQFANQANVRAHYTTTGPEIWQQMNGDMDALVCGVGTGGTLTGIGNFLKEKKASIDIVLADPEGSVLVDYVESGKLATAGSWLVEGIGEDFIPDVCDITLVDEAYTISDAVAFATVRELLEKQGIMAGTSSGTLLAAALQYCQAQKHAKRVVTLFPDSGSRYISKVFNDDWMRDQGFVKRPVQGDLRDLIFHPYVEHTTVTVGPDDTLLTALKRAKLHSISQLPVLDGDSIVGIIDEWDMLAAVYSSKESFDDKVSAFMTAKLEMIDYKASIQDLMALFNKDYVAIVVDGESFLGIITRIDLINFLRSQRD
jgi:cystathionine beta-synthase